MNRKRLSVYAAILLLSAVSFQSCIGSFSLTNKVLNWNRNVSNKFVNELVFFAFWVLPVYEVTAAADLLIINSIEFWSGNIPMESNNQIIKTEDGNYYLTAHATGYEVTGPDGNILKFDFDMENQMWSFSQNNEEKIDFLQFTDENHVKILSRDGEFVDVEVSQEGVNNYLHSISYPMMASM